MRRVPGVRCGPLTSVTLGNGLTEARGFGTRYYPSSIVVSNGGAPIFDWQYNTDAEGNITSILDSLDATNHRTFDYQDFQYFLTQGDGPWGVTSRCGGRGLGDPVSTKRRRTWNS